MAKAKAVQSIQDILELNSTAWEQRNSNPEHALKQAREAYYLAESAGHTPAMASSLLTQGFCHYRMSRYHEALALLDEARSLTVSNGNFDGTAKVLNTIGQVFTHLGEYEKALDYYLESFQLHHKCKDKRGQSAALNSIGNIYYSLGKYQDAGSNYEKALLLDRELDDERGIAISLNNLGLVHQHLLRYEEALSFHRESLQIRRAIGDRHGEAWSLSNIGYACSLALQHENAMEYYMQSLALRKKLNDRYGQMNTQFQIGEHYCRQSRPENALSFLYDSLELAKSLGTKRELFEILRVLATALKTLGRYREALECFEEFHQAKEQVFNAESDQRLKRLMVQHQVERVQHDKEVYRLKNEQLQLMMQNKTSELSAMALNLVQRNEFLSTLQKQLQTIARGAGTRTTKALDALLDFMRQHSRTEEQWEVFSSQLEGVHRNFIYRLSSRYSALTPTEIRICSLLRLQLSTKEIALLLNVSVRNIEKHRLSIRKKLGLEGKRDLAVFLVETDQEIAEEITSEDISFMEKLAERFPQLTKTEQKVCSLLRANLSTKRIADILCVSSRTAENHRYHIRKKLNLENDANLVAFLIGM